MAVFIDKIGVNETVNLLYGINKHYFLIDKGDIKNGKILVHKVGFVYESSIKGNKIKERPPKFLNLSFFYLFF